MVSTWVLYFNHHTTGMVWYGMVWYGCNRLLNNYLASDNINSYSKLKNPCNKNYNQNLMFYGYLARVHIKLSQKNVHYTNFSTIK